MPNYHIQTIEGTVLPTSEAADNASGLRNALDLGTLATQNGTFSGESSGVNTGDQTIELFGDVTGNGTGNITVTINGINGVPLNSMGSGILKIDGLGKMSVATSPSSYPTLNQNTTGSAGSVLGTGITGDTLASGITKIGTLTQGVWQGTPVGVEYGGTGANTTTGAFTALQPQNLFPAGQPTFAGLTVNGPFSVGGYASIEAAQGDISTSGTISATGNISTKAKLITVSNDGTPTNITANDAGITIPSTAGAKTLTWVSTTDSWTSNQNFNIANTKTYKINGTDVLSSTTLGSGIITSSLTSVGTVGTGYWNSFIGTTGTAGVNYVTAAQVIAAVNIGTLDPDLTAIAGLTGTSGFLKKTAINQWTLDTSTFIVGSDERLSNARLPIIRIEELATITSSGWMSAADKVKLNGITGNITVSFENAALTGVPTAPTAGNGTTTTQIATTQFVDYAITNSRVTSVGTVGTGYWNSFVGTPGTAGVTYVTADQVIAATKVADDDIVAIAGLTGTSGLLKKFGTNQWTLDDRTFIVEGDERLSNARTPTSHTHAVVTTTVDGFMSSTDKAKLDNYPATPVVVSFENVALTGVPTAPTATVDTTTSQIATTQFVSVGLTRLSNTVQDTLFNNILEINSDAIIIDNTYIYQYVRLLNTGSITILLPVLLDIDIGSIITFRRTTNAGDITLTPDSNVAINDVDTVSVLGGDTFMIKYLGLSGTTHTWDFI